MEVYVGDVQERKKELEKEFEQVLKKARIKKGKFRTDLLERLPNTPHDEESITDGWNVIIISRGSRKDFYLIEKPSKEFVRMIVLQHLKKGEYEQLDTLERYHDIDPNQREELWRKGFIGRFER